MLEITPQSIKESISFFVKISLAIFGFVIIANFFSNVPKEIAFILASLLLCISVAAKSWMVTLQLKELEAMDWAKKAQNAEMLSKNNQALSEEISVLKANFERLRENLQVLAATEMQLSAANAEIEMLKASLHELKDMEERYKSQAAKIGGLARALKAAQNNAV
jgi:septal ring factor EnvC (AmiA/AmiB activator)